jgi:hypothetical protein
VTGLSLWRPSAPRAHCSSRRNFCSIVSGRMPGLPGGKSLFFASPKKSNPKKGEPESGPLRCAAWFLALLGAGGVRLKLACGSNSRLPLSACSCAAQPCQRLGSGQPKTKTKTKKQTSTTRTRHGVSLWVLYFFFTPLPAQRRSAAQAKGTPFSSVTFFWRSKRKCVAAGQLPASVPYLFAETHLGVLLRKVRVSEVSTVFSPHRHRPYPAPRVQSTPAPSHPAGAQVRAGGWPVPPGTGDVRYETAD